MNVFADHLQMHTSAFLPCTHIHTLTHMINVATLPGLTFTAMQSKERRLSYPAQSFIFPFIYSAILSASVLFRRPLFLSHSFAHDPIFSRPGWLPLGGDSRAGDLLLEQLLVELKRVPVHPLLLLLSLPPCVHSTALSSSGLHCLERERERAGEGRERKRRRRRRREGGFKSVKMFRQASLLCLPVRPELVCSTDLSLPFCSVTVSSPDIVCW